MICKGTREVQHPVKHSKDKGYGTDKLIYVDHGPYMAN